MKITALIVLIVLVVFAAGCAPKTEIREKGQGGAEIVIAPSAGDEIKGMVKITLANAPEGTGAAAFVIQGEGIPDMRETGPNIGWDSDAGDGWSTELDTTKYANSRYRLYALAFAEMPGQGEQPEPTAGAMAEAVIANQV